MNAMHAEQLDRDADLSRVLREYVQVAERLERTHRTLEEEVKRLRSELRRKDRELAQRKRLAALGEMAAGVAHEVRNPLGAIQLYSGLLKRECQNLPPALKLIESIEAGIHSVERVVQSTLALTPGRSGRLRAQPLRCVVERAIELAADAFQRRPARLESTLPDDSLVVRCDDDALHRALLNLLVNAAEASPPDGVVSLNVMRRRRSARITVRDRGSGLSDDARERLFHPFFTTKDRGTGLGLSIAHRIVEDHGGKLTQRNHRGGGAEFLIALPLAGSDSQPPRDDSSDLNSNGSENMNEQSPHCAGAA